MGQLSFFCPKELEKNRIVKIWPYSSSNYNILIINIFNNKKEETILD